jgi:4-aminobutyrate aminotransferase-like enzyme
MRGVVSPASRIVSRRQSVSVRTWRSRRVTVTESTRRSAARWAAVSARRGDDRVARMELKLDADPRIVAVEPVEPRAGEGGQQHPDEEIGPPAA